MKVADVRSGVKVDQSFHQTNRLEDSAKAAPGLSTAISPAGPVSPVPTQQSHEALADCRMSLQGLVPAHPLRSALAPDHPHANSKRETPFTSRFQTQDFFCILFRCFPLDLESYSHLRVVYKSPNYSPCRCLLTIFSSPSNSPRSHLMHLSHNPHPTDSQLHPEDFKPQVKNKYL